MRKKLPLILFLITFGIFLCLHFSNVFLYLQQDFFPAPLCLSFFPHLSWFAVISLVYYCQFDILIVTGEKKTNMADVR